MRGKKERFVAVVAYVYAGAVTLGYFCVLCLGMLVMEPARLLKKLVIIPMQTKHKQ